MRNNAFIWNILSTPRCPVVDAFCTLHNTPKIFGPVKGLNIRHCLLELYVLKPVMVCERASHNVLSSTFYKSSFIQLATDKNFPSLPEALPVLRYAGLLQVLTYKIVWSPCASGFSTLALSC